jgi:hypothetical protein
MAEISDHNIDPPAPIFGGGGKNLHIVCDAHVGAVYRELAERTLNKKTGKQKQKQGSRGPPLNLVVRAFVPRLSPLCIVPFVG